MSGHFSPYVVIVSYAHRCGDRQLKRARPAGALPGLGGGWSTRISRPRPNPRDWNVTL